MKVMAVLSVSLSKNIDKRMEKEYTLIDKVFFDLTVMSTDQEEKKEAIKISGVVMSVKILGTGSFLPEKSVSNDDLSKVMDTNDEWILSRTGIRSRHISIEDTTSTMAVKAAEKALEDAGADGADYHGARGEGIHRGRRRRSRFRNRNGQNGSEEHRH